MGGAADMKSSSARNGIVGSAFREGEVEGERRKPGEETLQFFGFEDPKGAGVATGTNVRQPVILREDFRLALAARLPC